jgi:hypothetical protein
MSSKPQLFRCGLFFLSIHGDMDMNILKLAAFSRDGRGGNPAGLAFYDAMPREDEMLRVAKFFRVKIWACHPDCL